MFFYLFYILLFVCSLHILFNYNYKARKLGKLPGLKGTFLFGDTIELIQQSSVGLMKLARELAKNNPGIYKIWTFPFGAVNIYNPEDVEIIISNMKYNEKSIVYKILRPWLGDGLLLSKGNEKSVWWWIKNTSVILFSPQGHKWQERRKILTPAFHFNILRQFSQIISENSERLVDNIREQTGKPVDVVPILSEFTLHSICETAMGTQLSQETSAKSYKEAIYDLGFIFYQRIRKVYLIFDFFFNLTPTGKKQKRYIAIAHDFTRNVIEKRKEYINQYGSHIFDDIDGESYVYKNKKKIAMLDLLLNAHKEGLIDDTGVQEEVDTFMFEGHDTTASGLTFCLMLLANNKVEQDKIYEELKQMFGYTRHPITMDDLPNMKYLERCIKESLRLYPPVHFISRNIQNSVTLSNYEIPANTLCHVHIYDLHRRPDQFEDPEKFDPDRFLPENSTGRHPYAYIPFSAGPRNCIGQKFAMMEMKMAVAIILREFKLEPVTRPSDIEMITDVVIRNNGPVNITFKERY